MPVFNIKNCRKCAFCKNWNDPSNSAIKPRSPKINLWSVDDKQKEMCLKKNVLMSATAYCQQYECKLEIQ